MATKLALSSISLLVGLVIGVFLGLYIFSNSVNRFDGREISRVGDPTGRYDALVLLRDTGEHRYWTVVITEKGKPADTARAAVFKIGDTTDLNAVWKSSRLLEIDYNRGQIEHLDNLWGHSLLVEPSFDDVGHWIEIQIVPLRPLLTPSGEFDLGP